MFKIDLNSICMCLKTLKVLFARIIPRRSEFILFNRILDTVDYTASVLH